MMKFVGLEAVQAVISKMKSWIITKMFDWWKTLQMSHVDGTKDQWEFSAELINGVPKLYLRTTDWKYSKCTETVANNWFPFTCAPAQYQNIKDGGKYQSYYFNSININPATGSLRTNGDITFDKLVINNGKSTEMILGNGTVKDIDTIQLNQQIPMYANITADIPTSLYEDVDTYSKPVCYGITNEVKEKLCSLQFFQDWDNGMVFIKSSYTKGPQYPLFTAEAINSLSYHTKFILYIVDNAGFFNEGDYCVVVANTGYSGINFQGLTGNEQIQENYFDFDSII